jgi:hypothetical protein
MFEIILAATARSYFFLRRFMPTAIVIDAINTRRGLKWGVLAMLLAVPYADAAVYCRAQIEAGGAGWLKPSRVAVPMEHTQVYFDRAHQPAEVARGTRS